MRGKSGIVHTLDSFSQLAVEPVGKFMNKSTEKLTNNPPINQHVNPAYTTFRQHRMPGRPIRGTRADSMVFRLWRLLGGLREPLRVGCYAPTRLLLGRYFALAQSRIASKKRSHSLSCSSSIHSFGVCAWAISPGPQMMLCTPARWNWPASVP